ncbi:MAG: galactokinase [Sphaerochaetaceae bacterium]
MQSKRGSPKLKPKASMKEIKILHDTEYEQKMQVSLKVPGIYTFIGEFSDYCNGYTLCGASPLTLEVGLSERQDQSVRLYLAPTNDRKRFNLQNLKYRREDRWANIIKGVLSVLSNRGYKSKGFNITLNGELLLLEDTMVNSAIALATTLALRNLFFPSLKAEECGTIGYSALSSFVGEKCRLVIFYAMLEADDSSYLLYDLDDFKFKRIPFNFSNREINSIVVESKISPVALKEELSLKRLESAKAFERLRELYPTALLRDVSPLEIKELGPALTENEKRICHYVLNESRLAKEASKLLEQKDLVMYGKSLSRLQTGLRDVFEVTCPEIDWLTKRALEIDGTFGATMITTGSSGSIFLLMSQKAIELYTAQLEAYEHIFGFKPTWTYYNPAQKLKIVSTSDDHSSY